MEDHLGYQSLTRTNFLFRYEKSKKQYMTCNEQCMKTKSNEQLLGDTDIALQEPHKVNFTHILTFLSKTCKRISEPGVLLQ